MLLNLSEGDAAYLLASLPEAALLAAATKRPHGR